jgi:hypothetical protein
VRTLWICSLMVVPLFCSAAANAQTVGPSPLFLTIGAFADVQRFGHTESRSSSPTTEFISGETDTSGTATGLHVGVGTHVTSRVALQLELGFSESRHKTLRPSQTRPTPPILFESRSEIDYRPRTVGFTAAYRARERYRIRPGYLIGVMFTQERSRTVTTSTQTPPGAITSRTDLTSTTYRSAPIFGLEADVRIMKHLAVVPAVRLSKIFGAALLFVRPGVSARWSF